MLLALAVLPQRGFSGGYPLYQTVARRLAFIDAGLEGADEGEQLALPFENRGETDAADVAPPWQPALRLRDPAAERRLLVGLGAAASSAAAHETKLSALSRLLRRIAEPVIVFTEFRDTLMHVARRLGRPALVLHGGLSRQERSSVLRAFAADSRAILLATDAAGEGLNLQRACRVVINLELPWNPMRLEQRIGRVDRIGQLRTVHVFHLVAAGTGEQRLLRDLGERISRARHDIGAPNPLGDWNIPGDGDADRAARLVVGAPIAPSDTSLGRPRGEWPGVDLMPDCLDGGVEAHRLRAERAVADVRNGTLSPRASESDTLATMARKTSTRLRLGATVLLIWEVLLEDGCGRHVCSEMTGTAVTLTRHLSRPLDRMSIERLLASTTAGARDLVEAGTAQRLASIRATVSSFITTRQVRERLIASAPPLAAYQPGLFDGRASHARAAQRDAHQQIVAATGQQLAILERRSVIRMSPPQLRLVLFP